MSNRHTITAVPGRGKGKITSGTGNSRPQNFDLTASSPSVSKIPQSSLCEYAPAGQARYLSRTLFFQKPTPFAHLACRGWSVLVDQMGLAVPACQPCSVGKGHTHNDVLGWYGKCRWWIEHILTLPYAPDSATRGAACVPSNHPSSFVSPFAGTFLFQQRAWVRGDRALQAIGCDGGGHTACVSWHELPLMRPEISVCNSCVSPERADVVDDGGNCSSGCCLGERGEGRSHSGPKERRTAQYPRRIRGCAMTRGAAFAAISQAHLGGPACLQRDTTGFANMLRGSVVRLCHPPPDGSPGPNCPALPSILPPRPSVHTVQVFKQRCCGPAGAVAAFLCL